MRASGRFELIEQVGVGAFGAVWRARDLNLGRIVALKIPHPGLWTDPADRERFVREARAAAQLTHHGIVTTHEVVSLDGMPTIVSEFVEGQTLQKLIQVRRPTFREAAVLLSAVADALDYAHSMGSVHRDVKPSNIMIETPASSSTEDVASTRPRSLGRPLLLDFGLARSAGEATLTVEGQIVGTPAYMSPEQAAGRGHGVDGRTDVYGLGVVLYELICGEPPFRGSPAALLQQVLHDEPRPPSRLSPRVPRDLETICLTAMSKEAKQRYATAREMGEDLRRYLEGEPIRARPLGAAGRLWRWSLRNRALAALIVLIPAFMIALFAGTLVAAIRFDRDRRKAVNLLGRAVAAERVAKAARARRQSMRCARHYWVRRAQRGWQATPATARRAFAPWSKPPKCAWISPSSTRRSRRSSSTTSRWCNGLPWGGPVHCSRGRLTPN